MIKDCVKLAEKSQDKQKDTEVVRWNENKIRDTVQRTIITINVTSFARAPEMTYSMTKIEQLLENL